MLIFSFFNNVFVLMLQRYGDYNIKEIFAFIFSKSNEDKKGITP